MKLWTLAIAIGVFTSITQAEDSKDASLKAWGHFVGNWNVTLNDGETFVATIRKSESGSCYIHENAHLTQVVGWDAERKMVRAAMFFTDGGHGEGLWKLTGDAPKFEGHVTLIEDDGERTMVNGSFTFDGPDRWQGVFDGETQFKVQRVPK